MPNAIDARQALDEAKLSKEHWRVWSLSAMGIFLDGFDLFIIAIALPFIIQQYHPSHALSGLIVSAAPLGCILGATVFGRLTDHVGRKVILLLNVLFFVIFAGATAFSWNIGSLIIFRFLLGIGIGADYPVSSTYIIENMPKRIRGKMLVGGFGFQALGVLAAAATGLILIHIHPEINVWRWMLGIAVIPATIILLLRFTLPESTRWLIHKGDHAKATQVANRMTGRKIKIEALEAAEESSFLDLFTPRYAKRTIITSGTWFIMDVAFYGVNFFVPIILATLAFSSHGDFISRDIAATKGAALLDTSLVLGILLAIFLVEKWGRIKLQSVGFFGMAIGFFMIAASQLFDHSTTEIVLLFAGFIIFNVTVNMGPNPITFLLPAESFPTHLRATGHGFAAASGKVGAALGGIIIPILISTVHVSMTMVIIGVLCLIGFFLTVMLGYETRGKSLDDIGRVQSTMTDAEVAILNVQRDIQRLTIDIKHVETALTKAIENMRRMQER